MRTVITFVIVLVSFLLLTYFLLFILQTPVPFKGNIDNESKTEVSMVPQRLTEWEIFKVALAWVESELDSTVCREDTNAGGILQLTPIYIREVNRLSGYDKWGVDDRSDPVKSFQIFEDMMSYKNPSRDIDTAIKIHNPKAGKWYYKRVLKRMEQVKNYENARYNLQIAYMQDVNIN